MDYSILDKFERALSEYTGAPYVVLTDSCTHAIELCLRHQNYTGPVILPSKTYLSIPMVMHKLNLQIHYDRHADWKYEYRIAPTNIWDSARCFRESMYRSGMQQCLSFGHDKRLAIGHGGAILLDKKTDYIPLKRMAYDGRDLSISPWQDQQRFSVGYHYGMRLEDAQMGIDMLTNNNLRSWDSQLVEYPDISDLDIDIPPK